MGVGVVGSRKLGFQGQDRIIHLFTHSTDALSSVLGAVLDTKGAEMSTLIPEESIFDLGIHGRRRKIRQYGLIYRDVSKTFQ